MRLLASLSFARACQPTMLPTDLQRRCRLGLLGSHATYLQGSNVRMEIDVPCQRPKNFEGYIKQRRRHRRILAMSIISSPPFLSFLFLLSARVGISLEFNLIGMRSLLYDPCPAPFRSESAHAQMKNPHHTKHTICASRKMTEARHEGPRSLGRKQKKRKRKNKAKVMRNS